MLRLEAQGRGNRRVVCGTRHGQRPSPDRQCRYPALLRGVSAPGVEAVEVQDGVQHHRIASPGFAAIDRVNGEQHDVAFARGRVHHGGALGDLVAALDQAGDEQVLAVGVAENHARPEGWRNHAETVAFLFVQHRRRLPGFGLALFRDLDSRSEEHTSELQSRLHLVCRLLLEKKKNTATILRMLPPAFTLCRFTVSTIPLRPFAPLPMMPVQLRATLAPAKSTAQTTVSCSPTT